MKRLKTKKLWVFLGIFFICVLAGTATAVLTRTQLRFEEIRMSDINTFPCPENYTQNLCDITLQYNPQASAGFEGYPLVSGRYYCISDDNCFTVERTTLMGPISMHMVNIVILSGFYILMVFVFLWIRARVKRNTDKTPYPV